MKNRIGLFVGIAVAIVVSSGVISAQERQPAPQPSVPDPLMIEKIEGGRFMQEHPHPPMPPMHGGDFLFFASEMSFDGKLVKGAPYSAEAITESTQTLNDGNRIVHKSTASIYRDSEGRTRREQALRAIGPFANEGAPSQTIHISDPVASVSYVLDPRAQIAHKMPPMRFKFQYRTAPPEGVSVAATAAEPFRIELHSDGVMDKKMTEAGVAMGMLNKNNPNSRTEALGKQNIGGVEADGTRTTVTIPAGAIGNERPIEIVSERWYSPELQIVVMTRHSDPRFGENSYRLTTIDRTEPARSLFEVPAGYKIEEASGITPGPGRRVRMRRPAGEQ